MNKDFGGEITRLWDMFVAWLPHLIGAIIAFLIGWIIAVILGRAATGAMRAIGLNRKVDRSRVSNFFNRITNDPAGSIGRFVYWIVMIIAITIAVKYLEIPILTTWINQIVNYVPNLIGAIFILVIAALASTGIAGVISRWMGDTVTGKVTATAIPAIIMSIAGFAILEQLGIAPVIISATYIALIGSLALAFGIAFGLGGRQSAERMLNSAYEKGVRNIGQVRRDVREGAGRAKEDVLRVKERTNR